MLHQRAHLHADVGAPRGCAAAVGLGIREVSVAVVIAQLAAAVRQLVAALHDGRRAAGRQPLRRPLRCLHPTRLPACQLPRDRHQTHCLCGLHAKNAWVRDVRSGTCDGAAAGSNCTGSMGCGISWTVTGRSALRTLRCASAEASAACWPAIAACCHLTARSEPARCQGYACWVTAQRTTPVPRKYLSCGHRMQHDGACMGTEGSPESEVSRCRLRRRLLTRCVTVSEALAPVGELVTDSSCGSCAPVMSLASPAECSCDFWNGPWCA